jgi:hypothetical protein
MTETAGHAPLLALHLGGVARSQWIELLEPVTDLVRQWGIEPQGVRTAADIEL